MSGCSGGACRLVPHVGVARGGPRYGGVCCPGAAETMAELGEALSGAGLRRRARRLRAARLWE